MLNTTFKKALPFKGDLAPHHGPTLGSWMDLPISLILSNFRTVWNY